MHLLEICIRKVINVTSSILSLYNLRKKRQFAMRERILGRLGNYQERETIVDFNYRVESKNGDRGLLEQRSS